MQDPRGDDARKVVAFAASLGMTAIHAERSCQCWPVEDGGEQSKEDVQNHGNASLRRFFTDCSSAAERHEDEWHLQNRVNCHACGTYCLRPLPPRKN